MDSTDSSDDDPDITGTSDGPLAPGVLYTALEEVRDDLTAVVALVWTWLTQNLQTLGSESAKAPEIRERSRQREFDGQVTDADLDEVRAQPWVGAAVLLARIERHLARHDPPAARRSLGIDGEPVLVSWRVRRELGDEASPHGDKETPPSAAEHPSLTAFAPRLRVDPVHVNGIELEVVTPHGPGWDAADTSLEHGLAQRLLEVHLDPLEDHGMSGWTSTGPAGAGRFDPSSIAPEDETACSQAAHAAVANVTSEATILITPELAATPAVLGELKAAIAAGVRPALSVVGLYHRVPGTAEPPPLPGTNPAPFVNEAVVLGPDGEELWCHRKLSYAEAGAGALVEHIRLGHALRVVPTAIGTIAVVICLDSFQPNVAQRLEASPASVLLVPSLSPKVLRHRDALKNLVQRLWGVAFVCNRAPGRPGDGGSLWNQDENRSFWAVQRGSYEPGSELAYEGHGHPSFIWRLKPA